MAAALAQRTVMTELSVIIPTYNRAERLQACLEALARQTQPFSDFEVVVVVDGATDETMAMLAKFAAPYPLRTVWQENAGPSQARNHGSSLASGQYCLFIDDDIIAGPDLVGQHLRAQRKQQNVIAIGQITLSLPADADWYAHAFARGWRDHYQRLNQEGVNPTWEDCYSGNMSVSREIFLKCGGFDVTLVRGEDVELAYRLQRQGCTFVYLPDALGHQDERKGFGELSQDSWKAGMADAILYQRDPQILSLALASFTTGSWRKLLLRRLLLAGRVPPHWLAWVGRLLKKEAHRYSWHTFIQHFCYWRGVRYAVGRTTLWSRLTAGTPILMYHALGTSAEPAAPYLMPARRFAAHLAWLQRLGYRVISLDQFLACRREKRLPSARSVVITFDDGYLDNYTLAFPILQQRKLPATIFLVSDYVGQTNQWDKSGPLAERPLLDWLRIKEMAAQGIQFGAHTCTHVALTAVSPDQAAAEITDSRERLACELNQPITTLAYPYGEHDPVVQSMVEQAGFAAACTVDPGLNNLTTPAVALRRVEIRGTDSIIRLWLALWLGDADAIWPRKRKTE
jgi:peptidoglycan/xylan/chitin deacetylase (PgdA/CDA1 family)/glycosyltransferase involved in cell wall biosynthesis